MQHQNRPDDDDLQSPVVSFADLGKALDAFRNRQPDRCELRVEPLRKGMALRNSARRSKGSERGEIVCPKTNVVILTESGLEHNAVLCAFADPKVVRVRDQDREIRYRDAAGAKRKHVLDLRIETDGGYVYGGLVKPQSKAIKQDLRGFATELAKFTPKSVADELVLIDERAMPEWEIRNATLFNSVRRGNRTVVDDELTAIAPTLVDEISICALSQLLGGGQVAFKPIARAIFYGTLECTVRGLITSRTLVRFSGKTMPDLDKAGPVKPARSGIVRFDPPKQRARPGGVRFSYRAS